MRQVVWCLGMYASASTWLFNVAQKIEAIAEPVTLHFCSEGEEVPDFAPTGTHLVKSHEVASEAVVLQLARRAQRLFVTRRDPRDAVCSLMLYHKHDFERSLALVAQATGFCAGFARDRRALTYDYETGFFDNIATVHDIAAHLGRDLSAAQAADIFAAMQRGAVEDYIAAMPGMAGVLQDQKTGDRLDPRTHWHTHHAGRTGEAGRWRQMLAPAQVLDVERRLVGFYQF